MRCSICHRPLLHPAVPGLAIGPKCAKDRGLLPEKQRRPAAVFTPTRRRMSDAQQLDWINELEPGQAGSEGKT